VLTSLKDIEEKYRYAIEEALKGMDLTAALLVELSSNLYHELKLESVSAETYDDMLLFQYGVYDWGDEFGRHFSLDITRQFTLPLEYEPYQLSFTLIFEPAGFEAMRPYDCWSMSFAEVQDFIAHVKSTDGFMLAEKHMPKAYSLRFFQC